MYTALVAVHKTCCMCSLCLKWEVKPFLSELYHSLETCNDFPSNVESEITLTSAILLWLELFSFTNIPEKLLGKWNLELFENFELFQYHWANNISMD